MCLKSVIVSRRLVLAVHSSTRRRSPGNCPRAKRALRAKWAKKIFCGFFTWKLGTEKNVPPPPHFWVVWGGNYPHISETIESLAKCLHNKILLLNDKRANIGNCWSWKLEKAAVYWRLFEGNMSVPTTKYAQWNLYSCTIVHCTIGPMAKLLR